MMKLSTMVMFVVLLLATAAEARCRGGSRRVLNRGHSACSSGGGQVRASSCPYGCP